MAQDEISAHARNSNLIGNLNRMEEMAEGRLSPSEQAGTFQLDGIHVAADAIEAILPALSALRAKPLSRRAVATAIANHDQILAEQPLSRTTEASSVDASDDNVDEEWVEDGEEWSEDEEEGTHSTTMTDRRLRR